MSKLKSFVVTALVGCLAISTGFGIYFHGHSLPKFANTGHVQQHFIPKPYYSSP